MKFLALLRDSIREATDTAVIWVTVGLTALFLLLVASLSFRPVTMQEVTHQFPDLFNLLVALTGQSDVSAEIVDFRQTNDAPTDKAWLGDYSFALVFHLPSESKAQDFGSSRSGGLDESKVQEIFEKELYWVPDIRVARGQADDPKQVRFDVRTQGSTITDVRDWIHEPTFLFFWKMPFWRASLTGWVYWIEDRVLNGPGSWACILTGVILTSFFVPNMLRKGTVDMLLVKPLNRPMLLLYKYVGGLTFVLLNSVAAVGGLWLVLGVRTGIWAPGVLVDILGITFYFALLYAVSVLIGVLTRSPITALSITLLVWLVLWGVGSAYEWLNKVRGEPAEGGSIPRAVYATVDALHFVLPRTTDLDILMTKVISGNLLTKAEIGTRGLDQLPNIAWYESLLASAAFLAVMLGLACWRFATKDY